MLNTPNSVSALVENDYAISNHESGLVVSNVPAISISGVDASNNGQDGIVISNVTLGTSGLLDAVTVNNGVDGIVLQNTPFFSISSSAATGNGNYGFYVFNSMNVTMFSDNATSNSVGVYITGLAKQSYGGAQIVDGNFVGNNVGIQVNGLDQKIAGDLANSSSVVIDGTVQVGNNIGTLAANDSVVSLESNTIGLNSYGVIIQNSLPLVVSNVISENDVTGLNISGSYAGSGECQVEFTNSTIFSYSACIAVNYLTLNGAPGLAMSNLNGSFVYENAAVGNAADGFYFSNMTASVISSLISISNENNGITVTNSVNSRITANELGGNLNGMNITKSSNNTVDLNNATLNALDGILFSGSSSNIVTGNVAIQDAGECTNSLACSAAAGIELFESSGNVVYSNTLTNNTTPSGTGAGIYINFGSGDNAVFLNNATLNDVGIAIASSGSNNIAKNILYSDTYGILLSNAPGNTILNNNFGGDVQDQYPNQPTVALTSIKNGTSISWTG